MKSMKISSRGLLPLMFLPMLFTSCTEEPKPISFGHDNCHVCANPIANPAVAALAVDTQGSQFNYDSIECMIRHIGSEAKEMQVIKVADYQHPGFMLDAYNSHYKVKGDSQLTALRHYRANSLCWKELQSQVRERTSYFSQTSASEKEDLSGSKGKKVSLL